MAKQRTILYIQTYSDELRIETIKNLLPFKQSKMWQKGDPMIVNGINKNRPWISSNWAYEGAEKEVNEITKELTTLLETFLPYRKELVEIKKLGFETYVCLVIHYENGKLPDFSLNSFCIKTLTDLDLELSYDNYSVN
jgi:hypothetical protein